MAHHAATARRRPVDSTQQRLLRASGAPRGAVRGGARSSGAVTIDVPPPTPLGYTALPSEPVAAGLTVHIVEAQREQPPKPLEAL